MYIDKIIIENFKCFKGQFPLKLNKGLNILVGDNETGKSTILEAIHLVLSGLLNGKYIKLKLTQDLFNNTGPFLRMCFFKCRIGRYEENR